MNDIKNTLFIILGCVVVVVAAILGLTKMSDQSANTNLTVDQNILLDGARFLNTNGETKVNVVVFSDIQCPACKTAKLSMKELETTNGVNYVFRHFPLPANVHKYALISAKAVEAGRVMGKGWKMMDIMFDKQEIWAVSKDPEKLFVEYATSIGLDVKKFVESMNSKEVAEMVNLDLTLANSLTLSGTPTVFVNGEQVGVPFVKDKVMELLSK